MSRKGIVGLVVALSMLLVASAALAQPWVGDIAPDFKITTLDGKEISYQQDIKAKRPLYLIFWATW